MTVETVNGRMRWLHEHVFVFTGTCAVLVQFLWLCFDSAYQEIEHMVHRSDVASICNFELVFQMLMIHFMMRME